MRSLLVPITMLLTALTCQAQTVNFDRGYALVFPKNGIGFPVRSLQLYGDSVICLSPELRVYAKSDIAKILVRNATPTRSGPAIGAILGVYSLHYALGRASNQPGAFLSESGYGDNSGSQFVWTTLLGIALGGGLGYLTDAAPGRSMLLPYVFAGNAEVIDEQWRLFIDETGTTAGKPKFHFTLSGGSVTTPTSDGYRTMLENDGFTDFRTNYYGGSFFSTSEANIQEATNFNWLRKASIEYSITDNIRAGLAATWLSEPALFGRKGDEFGSTNEVYEFLQKLDGHGYYATGSYHYYPTRKRDLELTGMLGVGMANIDHEIKGWYRRNSGDTPEEDVIFDTRKYFSFITSVGVSYSLFPSLSLGLTANYFYGGSATMDEMFIIDLPKMDVTYSTTDVGFTIGLHF